MTILNRFRKFTTGQILVLDSSEICIKIQNIRKNGGEMPEKKCSLVVKSLFYITYLSVIL